VTADDFASCVLETARGAVATITLSAVAHHGPGHLGQVTGSDGTLLLSGETQLELGNPAGGSVRRHLGPRRSLGEDEAQQHVGAIVRAAAARHDPCDPRWHAEGEPATFRDGWQVQRVLDAIRGGRGVQLD